MTLEAFLSFIDHFRFALPYIYLSSIIWAAYLYVLRCGFVSDDHAGLGEYDGKLQGWEYGMVSRWIRFHLCGGNFPSGLKSQSGNDIPQGKIPQKHHLLSILVFNVAVLLGYAFLSKVAGPKVAFIALGFFAVSPVGTQAVAWISALGYPLSLFWIFLILNFIKWYYSVGHSLEAVLFTFLVFALMSIMAINALFVALVLPAILIFFGYYPFAILSAVISLIMGFRIVKETIVLRANEFKKQDMGNLTKLNPRRVIVAFKTVFYYLEMLVWPNRLGLYHEWGNHFTPSIERDDRRFWLGLIATAGLIGIFFLSPDIPVKLGILWFFSFIFIFLNWITIQQFVTERYLWIPSIGYYLIVAHALQDYPLVLCLIGGIYICRTWLHLPTYDDELRFYQSNTWNFTNSETALANLGCTWIRLGCVGSALDAWHASAKANPDYDVPYANIYFHYRSNAMLDVEHGNYESAIEKIKAGFKYIDACCKCSIKHFKDDWKREYDLVTGWIQNPLLLVVAEKKRLEKLRSDLMARLKDPSEKDAAGVNISLSHIEQRLIHIADLLKKAPQDKIPSEDKVEPTTLILPGQEKK